MLALLLAIAAPQAAPQTAVDAERAFAADAKTLGQWTAFRKWATDDAVIFQPQAVNARKALLPLKDPLRPVEWSPARSFVSCDGKLAANTGPWRRPDGSVGYFTTIWYRQPDGGWKWEVDHGDVLSTPRAEVAEPEVRRAACSKPPFPSPLVNPTGGSLGWDASPDGTLRWWVQVEADGARRLVVLLWDGERGDVVIQDDVAAPVSKP